MNNIYSLIATAIDTTSLPGSQPGHGLANQSEISTVLGIVFGVVGAISLLVITISGFRYVISDGDPKRTAQAKEGIIYSIVGLFIALSAEAIVTFVIGKL